MKKIEIKGATIPALGLGTFQLRDKVAYDMIQTAIGEGIYHIDTAQMYQNEAAIGDALKDAAPDRDKLFITTKVLPDNLARKQFLPSVEESLRKLKSDYVDLLLVHWPNSSVPVEEYIEQLVKAQEKGYTKYIGVSNHTTGLLDQVLATGADIITNQVEYHPLLNQDKLYHYLREKGLTLTAYSPIAQGEVLEREVLQNIAEKYNKNAIQITLRWLIQQVGVLAIPRTSKKERIASNFNVFDFELTPEETEQINQLKQENKRLINPSFAPGWD
ncbi:aldo/keto reductase [Pontibacter sp. SGAir0037]|uniref:aldo/keto reductase n=1 Tax=Pontibacter sp. SGAir0037 TaxID=2571030 RepID=UPI0010CD2263|nr:aldo/keto reductase [Pontibacter sp. SGAir0037]QCR23867.1 aldo/keto reductase [Pontibacter sp. SGAir0037]